MSWLTGCENIFVTKGLSTDAEKIRFICTHLQGDAFLLYQNLPHLIRWSAFRTLFLNQYATKGNAIALRVELVNLRQRGPLIDAYIANFPALQRHGGLQVNRWDKTKPVFGFAKD